MKRAALCAGSVVGATLMFAATGPAAAVPALAGTACTSVSATASPATDTAPGITVTITGVASGCPDPLYKFWIEYPNSQTWLLVQGYGANSATYNFDTSSKPPGMYHFQVWARDASSPGIFSGPSGTWDTYTVIAYTEPAWPYTPCSSYTAYLPAPYSPTPPQSVGTTVTVSAPAPQNWNCPNPRFQFWMREFGGSWHVVQLYSASSTYTWNTGGLRADAYAFQIWARDASSPGAYQASYGSWDEYQNLAWYQLTSSPCQSVSVSASPASPQSPGTPVTFTGFPFGCPKPLLQFELLPPGSQTWQVVQAYSPSTTFSWSTGGLVGGMYRFIVKTRDTSSIGTYGNFAGTWDAYVLMTYVLTSTPCTSVTASTSGSNPVVITGSASGCASPRYQFEMLAPASQTWQIMQPYSPSASFSWSTAGLAKGTYTFIVKARDMSSAGTTGSGNPNGSWDAYTLISYTLT
jgi:hypothetical protein